MRTDSLKGLTTQEAKRLLEKYGRNIIQRRKKVSPIKLFLSQFTSPLIILLLVAACISLFIDVYFGGKTPFDTVLIFVIVVISGIAGFVQDYKAEKIIEELSKMATPYVTVIRDGKRQSISSEEIVPKDIVYLTSGDIIPADGIILKGEIRVNESALTGESGGVIKTQNDEVFAGTEILIGECFILVTRTGMRTKIGEMAEKLQEMEVSKTPFQEHMERFSKKLSIIVIILSILVFIIGGTKFGYLESFLLAISLAVAAIPEGLPAVITIALSLGSKRMLKKKALVRRLSVVESIGSVDVICVDKTGTLTEGKLTVKGMYTDRFVPGKNIRDKFVLLCSYLCNDAYYVIKNGKETLVGDEIDRALKQFSEKHFVGEHFRKLQEVPFTSERKMMSVVYEINGKKYVFSKGAPEVLIKKCSYFLSSKKRFSKSLRKTVLDKVSEYSSKGYRLLGMAYKEYGEGQIENKLVWLGFIVFYDPPRKGVKEAICDCYNAGIRIIMITGDNPLTARAIADEVGLKTSSVITGSELDNLTDDEIIKKIELGVNVFARTTPFHKLRLLELLQKRGHVVAMTGDGVNDALALKKADVGIAMGDGTQVAKEASDMVLLDNNFINIRDAVKEGRTIFNNIRKFTDYLLTCNFAEVATVVITTLCLPYLLLYPVQILWINLITDGLPAIALGVDPPTSRIMKRPPRKKTEGILTKRLMVLISGIGLKKSLVLLGTFLVTLPLGIERARTTFFTGFIVYEFVRLGAIRYNEGEPNWLRNKVLDIAVFVSVLLHIFLIYGPLHSAFYTVPLGLYEWGILISGAVIGSALAVVISKISFTLTGEQYL